MEQYQVTNENNEVIAIINSDELTDFRSNFTGSFYNLEPVNQ
jgi:hypothetical protein